MSALIDVSSDVIGYSCAILNSAMMVIKYEAQVQDPYTVSHRFHLRF